jgi:hypothetical protein
VIECFYDRYQPALIVRYADWEERLRRLARQYGEASRKLGRDPIVEFWNEPYLNWGVKPGVNYDGAFYRQEGRTVGAPMTLHYETTSSPYLVWGKQRVAVLPDKNEVDYVASRYLPPELENGAEFVWRGQKYRIEERWWGRDRTQHAFWPGRQNVEWYNQMLRVFAPALKESNPHVTLIAGWGFHIHQNHYAAWEEVHRPTLDAAIQWLDGYTEHHYGGDTRAVAASYETVAAYTSTRHGRALRVWNTEAGGELDPEQPGTAPGGYNVLRGEARERGGFVYMVRDIAHVLDACPDKAAARAAHEAHTNRGVAAAFQLLKPLRGRLMEARSSHPDIWTVSSLEGLNWTVLLYNDSMVTRDCVLCLTAPPHCRIATIEERGMDQTTFALVPRTVGLDATSLAGQRRLTARLNPREARVWVIGLDGVPAPHTVKETQFFTEAVVYRLAAGAAQQWTIPFDVEQLREAESAFLRICARGWQPGAHHLSINDTPIAPDPTRAGIQDIPVPLEALKPRTVIQCRAQAEAPEALIENLSLWLRTAVIVR